MVVWVRLAFLGIIIGACSVPTIRSHVVYEDPTAFVRLEFSENASPENPETLNSHPADLTAEQVNQILQGLMVQEHRSSIMLWIRGEAELKSAFTEKEIVFLTPKVVKALRQAVPEEIVTFYLSYPLNSIKREVTSGAMFVKNKQVHVMLSNHRALYGIPPYGIVYDRRHPTYSLAPRAFDLRYLPSKHIVPQKVGFLRRLLGEENDGEVVIDLSRVSVVEM